MFMAWVPYLLLVVFVLFFGEPSIKAVIDRWKKKNLSPPPNPLR
jgi:L-lactate permease